ncbi:hypothetical protein [Alteromonas flava]|uniref:hypothetical protein n=1 Tax=Alteromonas flava TaxID=2048003 RepID=UPI000C2903FE|nr:hypothetical protein [Alteromonas flava]
MVERLPLYKKLTVLFRVEPGCLGPQGADHVEDFCVYVRTQLKTFESGIVRWVIKPRYDKSLPEIEYSLQQQPADELAVKAFFAEVGKSMQDFEEALEEKLAESVEEFFER